MIFWNFNNITIGKYIDCITDINNLKRLKIWVPKKLLIKRSIKLFEGFNKIFDVTTSNEKLNTSYHQFSMINRINNLFPALYHGFQACYSLTAITGKIPDEMRDLEVLYEKATGKKPTIELINKIPEKIDKLKLLYKDIHVKPKEEPQKGIDFRVYIMNLAPLLLPITIMDKKLKDIKTFEDLALSNTKKHGRN